MTGYNAYAKSAKVNGWTRIELLLAVYDKALGRLDLAAAEIQAGRPGQAVPHMAKAQLAVMVLANGVRAGAGNDYGVNMLRLYEYVVRQLTEPTQERVAEAKKVLTTLRQGFEAIRTEANTLERTGKITSGEYLSVVRTMA
jgi:flagellin-specific chaperone FliS